MYGCYSIHQSDSVRIPHSRHTGNFATEKNAIFYADFSHLSGVARNESSKKAAVCAVSAQIKNRLKSMGCRWLGRLDSNQRMAVPKTAALPLGDAPIALGKWTGSTPNRVETNQDAGENQWENRAKGSPPGAFSKKDQESARNSCVSGVYAPCPSSQSTLLYICGF